MSRGLILLLFACLTAALLPAAAEPPPPPQTATGEPPLRTQAEVVKPFMRAKLEHAQEVLRGVVSEDFDRIARHGQSLGLLSLESNWHVLQTEEYVAQSTAFRRATEALSRAGRERNLDAATVAYLDVTVKCVQCHHYLRRRASARVPAAGN